jgi:hypothetical protein
VRSVLTSITLLSSLNALNNAAIVLEVYATEIATWRGILETEREQWRKERDSLLKKQRDACDSLLEKNFDLKTEIAKLRKKNKDLNQGNPPSPPFNSSHSTILDTTHSNLTSDSYDPDAVTKILQDTKDFFEYVRKYMSGVDTSTTSMTSILDLGKSISTQEAQEEFRNGEVLILGIMARVGHRVCSKTATALADSTGLDAKFLKELSGKWAEAHKTLLAVGTTKKSSKSKGCFGRPKKG